MLHTVFVNIFVQNKLYHVTRVKVKVKVFAFDIPPA